MKIDVDTLSTEITQELAISPLEKALPPKLRYRFYKWLRQYGGPRPIVKPARVQKAIESAFAQIEAIKELKKHEVMTSFYDSGHIRMDFGGDVSEKVKEAAIKWAKKRGLKTSEASVNKSAHAQSYIIFAQPSAQPKGVCSKFVKYTV
jgi:hypothetical protein